MAANQLQVTSEYKGKAIVLTLMAAEILEDAEIQSLENAMMKKIQETSVTNVVLNFENVKFLSSAVLRVLIRVNTTVKQATGKLRLCSIDPKIIEVFKITRLDKVFDIRKNVDEAVEGLR